MNIAEALDAVELLERHIIEKLEGEGLDPDAYNIEQIMTDCYEIDQDTNSFMLVCSQIEFWDSAARWEI